MNLYHVSQDKNSDYDTYSDFVCAAETEELARLTCPNRYYKWHDDAYWVQYSSGKESRSDYCTSWTEPKNVKVKLIGKALKGTEAGIICSSFHAG